MKARLWCAVLASCILSVTAERATATVMISDANAFSLAAVNVSNAYSVSGFKPEFVTDGAATNADPFVFQDLTSDWRMSVSGFDSDIDTIRFFGWDDECCRASASVSVYYSSTNTTSITVGDYTFLKTASLPTVQTDATTQDSQYTLVSADGYRYAELTGLGIPTGTKSVLFSFGPEVNSAWGPAIAEIQGFASVPEPSCLILSVCGLLGLMAYAWRKRR